MRPELISGVRFKLDAQASWSAALVDEVRRRPSMAGLEALLAHDVELTGDGFG